MVGEVRHRVNEWRWVGVGDRDGMASGVAVGRRVLAGSCRGDDSDCAVAGLLAGEDGARSQAHASRPSAGPVLDHVAFTAARHDPKAEARDIAVPDEILDASDLGGIDHAFGQFRHPRTGTFQ